MSRTRPSLKEFQETQRQEIEETWPLLTFYYGITPDELARLPRWLRSTYMKRLPALLATEELKGLQSSMFPQLDQSTRRRVLNSLERQARRGEPEQPRPQTPQQFEQTAAALGIPIKFVNAQGEEVSPT